MIPMIPMTKSIVFLLALAAAQAAQAPAPPQKTEVVSVIGCLKEASPNNWTVINATDPVTSRATAPPANQKPTGPTTGKNQFKLIGVLEFNLAEKKDQTVIVKGMLVKATPASRINITSVTSIAPACAPAPK